MRHVKSRGIMIGEKTFQLINPNGTHSRKFNVVQKSKKDITVRNKTAKEKGIINTWISKTINILL